MTDLSEARQDQPAEGMTAWPQYYKLAQCAVHIAASLQSISRANASRLPCARWAAFFCRHDLAQDQGREHEPVGNVPAWTHAWWSQRHAQKLREARKLNPEIVPILQHGQVPMWWDTGKLINTLVNAK